MRALTPWTGIATIKKEMDRMFDRFWEGDLPALPSLGDWTPALDITEKKDAVVVKVEIPGIDAKDIELSLQDQVLTLKGEKRLEREEKDEHYYRSERAFGAFVRVVRLPAPVDASKVTAAFRNGLLTITLPKTAAAKGSVIPIKAE